MINNNLNNNNNNNILPVVYNYLGKLREYQSRVATLYTQYYYNNNYNNNNDNK